MYLLRVGMLPLEIPGTGAKEGHESLLLGVSPTLRESLTSLATWCGGAVSPHVGLGGSPAPDTAHTGSLCPSLWQTRGLGSNLARAGVPATAPLGVSSLGDVPVPSVSGFGWGQGWLWGHRRPAQGQGLPQAQGVLSLVSPVQRTSQSHVSSLLYGSRLLTDEKSVSEKWPFRQISVTSAHADVCLCLEPR